MIINNNIDISIYNASVSSKLIQPRSIILNSANVKENYFLINEKEEMKVITINILFQGKTRDEVYKNISDFMVNFRNEVDIKFNNISHNYKCYLVDSSIDETDLEEWLYLNLSLKGYEYGDIISHAIKGNGMHSTNNMYTFPIKNKGNLKSPCILEIVPTIDMIDFTIEGLSDQPIIINNLKKNSKIVIDSFNGSVTAGNDNKFNDVDMWEFPAISPGVNNIMLSRNECSVIINYYPRFM